MAEIVCLGSHKNKKAAERGTLHCGWRVVQPDLTELYINWMLIFAAMY